MQLCEGVAVRASSYGKAALFSREIKSELWVNQSCTAPFKLAG
jgi:hypothetical protein